MRIKILGTMLGLFSCTALGIWKWGLLYLQVRRLRELQDTVCGLKVEILYEQVPLHQAAEALAKKRSGGFFAILLEEGTDGAESFEELWDRACSQWVSQCGTTPEGEEVWRRLGRRLGYGSLSQQEQALEDCGRELHRLEEEALVVWKNRGRMYITEGICAGIFMAVLLA